MTTKELFTGKPRIYSSEEMKNLNEAYQYMLKVFAEYADSNKLSEEQKRKFHQLLSETFLERKMEVFLRPRIFEISKRLESSIFNAFSKLDLEKEEPADQFFTKILYYKTNKSLINNESI